MPKKKREVGLRLKLEGHVLIIVAVVFCALCFFHSMSFLTPPFLDNAFSSLGTDQIVCIQFGSLLVSFLLHFLFSRFLFFALSCFVVLLFMFRALASVFSSPVFFLSFRVFAFRCNWCLYSAVVVQSPPQSC